eukprot:6255246-Prymnesium_polylepis.3
MAAALCLRECLTNQPDGRHEYDVRVAINHGHELRNVLLQDGQIRRIVVGRGVAAGDHRGVAKTHHHTEAGIANRIKVSVQPRQHALSDVHLGALQNIVDKNHRAAF